MITKEIAIKIYTCYREIEAAEKLIAEIEENIKSYKPNSNAVDPFNKRGAMEMGVPFGDHNSQRIYQVQPALALSVIRSHIANQKAILAEANEQARIELDMK